MQRNFIAWYLNGSRGGELKDAAIVAFVAPDHDDWRFSLVKMDYHLEEGKGGKVKTRKELTPARRWSFLVGKNENSHTAQKQLLEILQNDSDNKLLQYDTPLFSELEQAFNIEKVTKEFFEKYRELFINVKEALEAVVQANQTVKSEFEAKSIDTVDFAKKLLGQIVFLYFLQKKGWFGVPRGKSWGEGDKYFLRHSQEKAEQKNKNFFNDYLEPLFYQALRYDRSADDDYFSQFDSKIPFLNGGLFDPMNDYDWINTDIVLPNDLFANERKTKEGDIGTGILDIFDRYNFTVKEDEPLEKDVAVDPEMLGRAYEKFNSIRTDNYDEYFKALKSGKKGEENKFNKQYGVYYTPREIVHYMCQESLANYLATELTSVIPAKAGIQLPTKEDIETLIKFGETAVEHDSRITTEGRETKAYSFKLPESIRKNAKLIDEKLATIRVCDPAVGSGAFPVGMMSEIIRTRNALTPYIDKDSKRTPYNFKRHAVKNSLYGVDIDPGAIEIAKLRLWLSLIVDEEERETIQPLPNLDYKIMQGNSLLGVEVNLFNQQLFHELEVIKPLYFNETSASKKKKYKKQIDELIGQITDGHKEFNFKVYFSEVFHEKQGFDVVIANPPYVQIKQIPENDRKIYAKKFKSAVGRFNLFYFFLEIASKIAKPTGLSTFIVPDRLLLNTQCDKLRKWLLQEQTILEIDSFAEEVFQAVVDNIVIIYKNTQSNGEYVKAKNRVKKHNIERVSALQIPTTHFLNSPNNQFDLNFDLSINRLIQKVLNKSVYLSQIADSKDGIIQSKITDVLFLNKPIDSQSKKLLFGKDIVKYRIGENRKWVNYKPKEMMEIELERVDGAPGLRLRNPSIFERNKILTRQTADEIIAAYDTDNHYYSNTLHGTSVFDDKYDPLYVLAILNSKLTTWFYRATTAESGKVFAQIKIEILKKLPILKLSSDDQKPIIKLVEQIFDITKDDDYLVNTSKQAKGREYEKQIDDLVYKLYNLTPDEIATIENK